MINNLLKIIELLGESKFFNFDTEEGIKISTNDWQPQKVYSLISFTDEEIISINDKHSLKAAFPIFVTEEGIVIKCCH